MAGGTKATKTWTEGRVITDLVAEAAEAAAEKRPARFTTAQQELIEGIDKTAKQIVLREDQSLHRAIDVHNSGDHKWLDWGLW